MTTSTSSLELQGKALLLLLMASIMPACAGQPRSLELQGAYRGDSGELVSIRSSQGKTLRARFFESGTSRRLHPTGELTFTAGTEFSNAEPVEAVVEFQGDSDRKIRGLLWTPRDSPPFLARRINLSERVTFDSDGSALSGRLDLPDPGQFTNPIAAVALVHGSGSDAATEYFYSGDFLAAHGIATLTYDKRGTGSSQGEYTFDFGQLADDAAAAIGFLSSHPGLDGVPLGLVGYSQGGWVAPLVASKDSRIEFVVVSYGLIASPAEEARVETRQLLASRGVADHHLDDLDRLTNASVEVVASGFEHGWEELARLKRRYRQVPPLSPMVDTPGRASPFPQEPRLALRLDERPRGSGDSLRLAAGRRGHQRADRARSADARAPPNTGQKDRGPGLSWRRPHHADPA